MNRGTNGESPGFQPGDSGFDTRPVHHSTNKKESINRKQGSELRDEYPQYLAPRQAGSQPVLQRECQGVAVGGVTGSHVAKAATPVCSDFKCRKDVAKGLHR